MRHYLKLPYKIIVEPDPVGGGYVVYCPDLPGCITQAYSSESIIPMIEEVKRYWLAAAIDDGIEIKEPEART